MPSDTRNSSTISSLLLKGGLIVLVGQFINFPLRFINRVMMADYLNPTRFGLLMVGVSLAGMIASLTQLGLGTGIARYLPRDNDKSYQRAVILAAVQMSMPIAILAGLLLVIFAEQAATLVGEPNSVFVLRVFGVALPVMVAFRLSNGGIQGFKSSRMRIFTQNILFPFSQLLSIGIVILLGYGLIGISLSYIIANGLAAAIGIIYIVKKVGIGPSDGVQQLRKTLIRFSLPLAASGIIFVYLGTVDTLLLARLQTAEDVGIYNAAYPLAKLLTVGLTAFGFLSLPVMSELDSEGEVAEMQDGYTDMTKWIFALTFPVWLFIITFPEEVIRLTFCQAYAGGDTVLVILSIAFVLHAAIGPNGDVLSSLGLTKNVLHSMSVAVVLNIVLNLVLIPRFSIAGAAAATTISYCTMNGLMSWQLFRTTKILPFDVNKMMFVLISIPVYVVVRTLIAETLGNGPIAMVAFGVLFGVLYTVVFLVSSAGESEYNAITQIESKLGRQIPFVKSLIRM